MKKHETPWFKLVHYYLACLRQEEINRLKLKTNSTSYCQLKISEETFFSTGQTELTLEPNIALPLNNWQKEYIKKSNATNTGSFYYAYPTVQQQTQILPIFYVEVKLQFNSQNGQLQIKRIGYTNSNRQYFLEDEDLSHEEVAEIIQQIDELTQPNIDPEKRKLKNDIPKTLAKYIDQNKITFKPICFYATETSYTSTLAKELKYMSTIGAKKLSEPLKYYITKVPEGLSPAPPPQNIVTLNPANHAQLKVILKINNTLLTCTGPPGTGKTQTIVNIIATSIASGKNVLMVSRNNKAVDNVYEKLVKTKHLPGILRLGKTDVRQQTLDRLLAFMQTLTSQEIALSNDLDELLTKSNELIDKIHHLSNQDTEISNIINRIAAQKAQYKTSNYSALATQEITNIVRAIGKPTHTHKGTLSKTLIELTSIQHTNNSFLKKFKNILTGNTEKKQLKKHLDKINELIPGFITPETNLISAIHKIKEAQRLTIPGAELLGQIQEDQQQLTQYPSKEKRNKMIAELWTEKTSTDRSIMQHIWLSSLLKLKQDPGRLLTLKNLFELEKNRLNGKSYDYNKWRSNFHEWFKTFPSICCTTLSLGTSIPSIAGLFDLVVIDEASQSDIPSILPALYRAKHAVIVGDEKQLQHVTNLSEHQEKRIATKTDTNTALYSYLNLSSYDRATIAVPKTDIHLFNHHYRCIPQIIGFSNNLFYNNELILERESNQDPQFDSNATPLRGIHIIDIDGQTFYKTKSASRSCNNPIEADKVIDLAINYIKNGKTDIGIITPYRYQKYLLEQKRDHIAKELPDLAPILQKNIEIGTIHTFQGNEKEIIIFSTVIGKRASKRSITWFDENQNLVNVAITRAKYLLLVVGRKETLVKSQTMQQLVNYIEKVNIFSK